MKKLLDILGGLLLMLGILVTIAFPVYILIASINTINIIPDWFYKVNLILSIITMAFIGFLFVAIAHKTK